MTNTPAGAPYPPLTNSPNVPQDMQNLAVALDSRIVGSFASAAARTAAYGAGTNPTAPTVGQVSYRQDAAVYEWYTGVAGGLWHPMPGGLMGTVNNAGPATSSGTNGVTEALFTALALSLTGIVSGKNYRVVWGGLYRVSVANTNATAVIHASQSAITTGSPVIGGCGKWVQQLSTGPEDVNECIWTPGASGTWNVELGIKSTGGTGSSQILAGQQNAFLSVFAA